MKEFNLEQVAIENIAYEGPQQSTYQTLKQLVAKMEKDQSFSVPKKYTKNLRTVIHAEFPEVKIKIRQVEGSDWIRAFRVL